jgi:hypothetical protein
MFPWRRDHHGSRRVMFESHRYCGDDSSDELLFVAVRRAVYQATNFVVFEASYAVVDELAGQFQHLGNVDWRDDCDGLGAFVSAA